MRSMVFQSQYMLMSLVTELTPLERSAPSSASVAPSEPMASSGFTVGFFHAKLSL